MKVLHFISDWRWTGPAEPALEMIRGLRAQGIEAHLAVTPLRRVHKDNVRAKALKAGIPVHENFHLSKHFHLRHNIADMRQIGEFIQREGFQIVHCHRLQDHLVAGYAAGKAGIPVVRSSHDGVPLKNNWRNRYAMSTIDLYLPVSFMAAKLDAENFDLPEAKIRLMPPAIDTDVFDPHRDYRDMRAELGIPKDKVLIGICARMQPYRFFNDLLDSWVLLKQQREDVHFTIIGRGGHMDEVAVQPSREKGLSDVLTFAGYHRETFIDMMNTLDIKTFMVAGTDGSCRALRQALALGIPAVGCNRGMIPELVIDGENGFVTDGTPEALADAQRKLVQDAELRGKFGARAREISVEKCSLAIQSRKLVELYSQLPGAHASS